MTHAAKGKEALESSDYSKALSHFTQALIDFPASPDNYLLRSTVFARLTPPRYDLALQDAEYAVYFAKKREKREKILASQQRRVVALYGLGKYADAKFLLTSIKGMRPPDSKPSKMEGDMWMAKVDRKLKDLSEAEKKHTVDLYPNISVPSEAKLKDLFISQLNPNKSFRFPEEEQAVLSATVLPTSTKEPETAKASTTIQPTQPPTTTSSTQLAKIRHEWYQSPQNVTVTLYAKGVPKDTAEIDITDTSVNVSFPYPGNPSSTFDFSLDPLFALIDSSQSKAVVMSTKIELTLRKAVAGQKWHNLEGTEPLKPNDATTENPREKNDDLASAAIKSSLQNPSSSTAPATAPSYPTSSRHGPKNWDKLADDLHAKSKTKKPKATSKTASDSTSTSPPVEAGDEEEIDSDFEGADSVDSFFKKLYAGSDDDTRRAMMKSFYESKGTALSTNWTDVGKGKVEEVKSKDD